MIEETENGVLKIQVNSETGQLCGIEKDSVRFMWGGGNPEASEKEKSVWANSSPLMFPVVGPSDGIYTGGKNYGMVQHGIARHLPWKVRKVGSEKISIFQEYDGKPAEIEPKKSKTKIQFPFSYELKIEHSVADDSVKSEFSIQNKSDIKMPYDFGWHPAFNISGETTISANEKEYRPKDVYKNQTLLLRDADNICLYCKIGKLYFGHDFGNAMIWGPESGEFISLEPVTGFPERTENGFVGSFGSCYLEPHEEVKYKSRITPTLDI